MNRKTDKYTEYENKLLNQEKEALDRVHHIVKKHEKLVEDDKEYQLKVKKSMAPVKGVGCIGDFDGKGYVDFNKKGDRVLYTKVLPPTSDARFETIDTLPRIASKYKKTDRGFSLEKMTKRDPNIFLQPTHGMFLSAEQKG